MQQRNLINSLGKHLVEKVRNLNLMFERICNDKEYISNRYGCIPIKPKLMIEELFFENVSPDMEKRFIECSLLIGVDKFHTVYQKIGRNGVRSFVNCVENNIELI